METSLRSKAQSIWHTQRVKRLVKDRMALGGKCLVSVQETVCTDPGCEGPATEIRVVTLSFQEIKAVIHKRPSEIAAADVANVI